MFCSSITRSSGGVVVGFFCFSIATVAWSPIHQRSSPTLDSNNGERRFGCDLDRRRFLQKSATTAATAAGVALSLPKDAAAQTSSSDSYSSSSSEESISSTSRLHNRNNEKIYRPIPGSLNGQVHVITGASTGLGLESAKRLAAGGATIVCTTRTEQKGERTVQQIHDYLQQQNINNPPDIYYITLDLDDLENSVKTFPNRYNETMKGRKIDVLMNNAGVAAIPQREITKDGYERTFQSNHLGPFVLTALLFPYLNRNGDGGARIINVSSIAHQFAKNSNQNGGMNLINNINGSIEYLDDGWQAYGNTKLENILFTQELQRRADEQGLSWLTVNSLHPGVVGTDIWRNTYLSKNNYDNTSTSSFLQGLTSKLFYSNTLTVEEGANTQVWLASATTTSSSEEIKKGRYYDEKRKLKKIDNFAQDPITAQSLWDVSEKLSGIEFKVV